MAMHRFELDDDVDDDDLDEDEDFDSDDEESDGDEDDEDDDDPEDDLETWQVAEMPLTIRLRLTFGHRTA
jgi:hypothetical protein